MSVHPTPQSVEELQALVQERLEQRQLERRKEERALPSAPLLWMTLVSEWTESLLTSVAQHLLGSEWNEERIGEFIDQLTERGWLRRTVPPALRRRSTPSVLQLDSQIAERQLERQLAQAREPRDLWANMAALAMAIEEAHRRVEAQFLPASTARWAHLAAASVEEDRRLLKSLTNRLRLRSWQSTAKLLEQEVEEAISAANPARAQRWLEAAQPLASVLGRTLDTTLDIALRRAALRLELFHRRRHDLKHLEHFLERDDQLAALNHLIREGVAYPHRPWALHLLGGGGVGKTMLVRHLTARLADREQWHLSIGRVDFDFLNPDYPRRSPGLLLWAFAQELRVFDSSGKVSEIFEDGDRVLRQLHDQLQAGESAGDLLSHPLLEEGLEIYGQALELLPQPVVLVIDTCEELTKPRAGVDGQFNVEATFHILERLHDVLPSLRVIFAGRRPLAKAGDGWTCASCALPPRPFLRLFEMRGFSTTEARTYLKHRDVPSHLLEPVVQRSSPDAGAAAEIQWSEGQGPEDIPRCNPYELHFYAEWALDDPPPSPEDIERAGGNRYVELRILRRLGHGALESLLPLLGLARHADEALLQTVSGLDGEAFEDLLRELEHQEWVEMRPTASAETPRRIFSMEEGLRLRLLSYFRDQAGQLEVQRQLAADALRRRTLEGDPAELDGRDLDAALRVMEPEPDADLWWRDVEARLFVERDAEWVAQQASFLVGPEGAATLPDDASWPELRTTHPLRPAVLATLALAESQTPGGGLTPWMEVMETATSLPNIGVDLALRARAMVLAAQHVNGFDLVPGDAWDLWQAVADFPEAPTPETVAALVAAAEAAVEHYEEHRRTPGAEKLLFLESPSDPAATTVGQEDAGLDAAVWASTDLRRRLTRWAAEAEPTWSEEPWFRRLEAMLLALDGRVMARLGNRPEEATGLFQTARRLAAGLDEAPSPHAWTPPSEFFTRLKLEAMRSLYPSVLSATECLQEFGARAPAEGVEWDRFLSQLAELALALGPKGEIFQELLAEKADDPIQSMYRRVHFETPPFVVRKAQLLAASGDVERGLQALQDPIRQAASLDTAVVYHAGRALLDLAIRLRLLEDRPALPLASSTESKDHALISLAHSLGHTPITHRTPTSPDTRDLAHTRWQTSRPPDLDACREAFMTAQQRLRQGMETDGAFDVLDAHLVLDGWEATLLDVFETDAADADAFSLGAVAPVVRSAIDATRQPEDVWRLFLRRLALSRWLVGSFDAPQVPLELDALATSLIDRLGSRRAALMAWREAELLALRLPGASANLFGIARRLFERVDDALSEAICLTAQCHCLMSLPRDGFQVRTSPPGIEDLIACWKRLGAEPETDADELAPHLRPWWVRARFLIFQTRPDLAAPFQDPSGQWAPFGADEPMLAWFFEQKSAFEEDDAFLSKRADPPQDEHTGGFDVSQGEEGDFDMKGGGGSVPEEADLKESKGSQLPSPSEQVSKENPPLSKTSPEPSPDEESTRGLAAWRHGLKVALPFLEKLFIPIALLISSASYLGFFVISLATDPYSAQDLPLHLVLSLFASGLAVMICGATLSKMKRPLHVLRRSNRERGLVLEVTAHLTNTRDDVEVTFSALEFDGQRWPVSQWTITRHSDVHLRLSQSEQFSYRPYSEHLRTAETPLDPQTLRLHPKQNVVIKSGRHSELPWEGMLATILLPQTGLTFRREARPRAFDDPIRESWPSDGPSSTAPRAVFLANTDRRSLNQMRRNWSLSLKANIETKTGVIPKFGVVREETRPEPIAHCIGGFIDTSAGYRMRLQETASEQLDLRAQNLADAFPNLTLLVLQESTVSDVLPRSAADRRQASYLRAFAAEAQQAGIPVVLTIPHLPPNTAERCVAEIAKLLVPYPIRIPRRLAASDPALLNTVDAIRRHIRKDPNVDDEAAWDVVLYSPPGWRNPFQ